MRKHLYLYTFSNPSKNQTQKNSQPYRTPALPETVNSRFTEGPAHMKKINELIHAASSAAPAQRFYMSGLVS